MDHWVLIKGMKQDQRHWLGFDARLAERTGGRVVCLDLPGVGTEVDRDCPWSVPAMAADLRGRWREAAGDDASGRWGVLGLSLGGMVALSWATAHPDDLATVVVGNTSARDVGGPHQRLRARAWPGLARVLTTPDAARRERRVLDLVSAVRSAEERDALAETYARFHAERPFSLPGFVRQLLAGARFSSPEAVPVPVLVLRGLQDGFVDPGCSWRLSRRLGAELREHPQAGHDLSLDAPDWLAEQLVDWGEGLRRRQVRAAGPS